MKILSIECSALPCSVAISQNGKIIASQFINEKLTHSQTLLPMIESVLKSANLKITDIDGFALSHGPGSFTGIRIGISAIKGLAQPTKIRCVGVSTLRAIAENYNNTNAVICSVMDARCNQVYNAIFRCKNGIITRLCDDRAILSEELAKEIELSYKDENVIIVGDGSEVFYPFVKELTNITLSDIDHRFQNAVGVALAAESKFISGDTSTPNELLPVYLRLPQAERELKLKKEQKL